MCCEAELVQQSEHSPGVVQDDENIAYVLVDPDLWASGTLAAAAFSKSKLSDGMSVYRPRHCTAEEAVDHIVKPQLHRNPMRALAGCLVASTRNIRALQEKNRRAVCVLDDGEQQFPAHAILKFSEQVQLASNSVKAAVRGNLTIAFAYIDGPISLPEVAHLSA